VGKPTNWRKVGLIAAGVAALFLILGAIGNMEYFARSPVERIRDECDKNYGTGTSQSFDCFGKLMTRFAIEQQQNKLDRTYRNAQ